MSTIVLVLIIAGTLYELYLQQCLRALIRQQNKELMSSETSSGIGCAISDCSDSMTNESIKKETLKDLSIVLNLTHNIVPTCVNENTADSNTTVEHFESQHLQQKEKLTVCSELLLSFSVITNFNAIFDRTVGSDTLPSIHGLRAISMAWVILGHTCIVIFKYSDNMEMRKLVEKNFLFQAITNGPYSVDTFFFISGCLVSYLYFRSNAKGKLNTLVKGGNEWRRCTAHFFGLILYRFMR